MSPSARKQDPQLSGRIRLEEADDGTEQPTISIHAVGPDGEVLASARVGAEGAFALPEGAVAKAHRVVVTATDGDPAAREAAVAFRPAALKRQLATGEVAISSRDWLKLLSVRRCVDATLRHCTPWRFVVEDLVLQARSLPMMSSAVEALPMLLHRRCAPVCEGKVEVYRRTCCCWRRPFPPYVDGPVFEPRIPIPEEILNPFEFPPPPPPPGPGPDPAPFALQEALFTGGAIDVAKLAALSQSPAILPHATPMALHRSSSASALHPVLFPPLCHCGPAVKVAEGFAGEEGSIHICWEEPLRFFFPHCRDEYAFVVRQSIAGATVTIYDGPASGQWFSDTGDISLTSYHPKAIGCRDESFPVPVNGAFVVLQEIGSTESHRLRTPLPDGPDSVLSPGAGAGLLDVDAGPDYALGGNLHLRYHFSEIAGASMKGLGARFFRAQWAPADANGDPAGSWETLPVPAWGTWQVVGTDVLPGEHSLGPNPVGPHPDLFHIPFETGGPLLANEEWRDGQFHAYVPTDSKVQGRYLVRIEVFDGAGNRLEPGTSPFTYRRWSTPIATLPVTFGALTHLIRTDNRPVVADIVDAVGPGAGAGDCKFFTGPGSVTIEYRAYHPEPGTPSFMLDYGLTIHRGVSGTLATPALSSTVEAGEGASPATHTVTIADLLDGEARCSFAVHLGVSARIHTGSGRRSDLDRGDIAAFAVQAS